MEAGGVVADRVVLTTVLAAGSTSTGKVVASRAGLVASFDGSLKSENPKTHNPVQIKAIAIRCALGKSKNTS